MATPTPAATPAPVNQSSIFSLPISDVDQASTDATALVLMNHDGSSVVCTNGNKLGIIIPGEQPKCQTINQKGGKGPIVPDPQGIVSSKAFNWKEGSKSNPDEWYTPSGQNVTTDPNSFGICGLKSESLRPKEIGIAVKGNNQSHQCVFLNKTLPLADSSILVLVK
ncbi:MAG: hypothetical protein HEEMFOPI_00974 [Holosporales bacterium]